MITEALEGLGASALGNFVAGSPSAFPWLETLHVIAISMVIGVIVIVDMRLVGLAAREYPISRMTRTLLPLTWIGFTLAVLSGVALFSSQPVGYFGNFAFRVKMILLIAAGVNVLVFHYWTMRGVKLWDEAGTIPGMVKTAGYLSILLWIAVVVFGRFVGFTMSPF